MKLTAVRKEGVIAADMIPAPGKLIREGQPRVVTYRDTYRDAAPDGKGAEDEGGEAALAELIHMARKPQGAVRERVGG